VGFGADGLLGPVPLDGTETERYGERWRLAPGPGERLLQARFAGAWKDAKLWDIYITHSPFLPEPALIVLDHGYARE